MRRALGTIALLALATAVDAAPRYIATSLGSLGGVSTEGRAINAQGQITGLSQIADGQTRAFVHANGSMREIEVPGTTESIGNAINADGSVAGCARFGGPGRGFVYRGGATELLPEKNGNNTVGCAVGINDAGYVVGQQYHDFQYSVAPSYLYFEGRIADIPQTVAAINNLGDLAGTGYAHIMPSWAWIQRAGAYTVIAGNESGATAINDRGQASGMAQGLPFLYFEGVLTSIVGLENSVGSSAYALNNLGDVVGRAWSGDGMSRAFLYTGGVMHDLNALVQSGLEGTTLTTAVGINDTRMIIANSCAPGPPYPEPCKAFRLDPHVVAGPLDPSIPALSPWALVALVLFLAGTGLARRRQR